MLHAKIATVNRSFYRYLYLIKYNDARIIILFILYKENNISSILSNSINFRLYHLRFYPLEYFVIFQVLHLLRS